MKSILNKKVVSSSLIEVTIALVIISLVFSLAIVVYLNIQKNSFFSVKLSYAMMMDNVFLESQKASSFQTREVNYEDVTIYQEVEAYTIENVKVVRLEARDEEGKLLAQQQHLVYVSDN